jgi:membrane-bound inhibitor of C-type lysozyme
MTRTALLAASAAALLFAGAAAAQQTPADKPGMAPKTATPPKSAQPAAPNADRPAAKPDPKAAQRNRVTYACDGGVSMTATYPPAAQAKTRPVKIALKDTTYFVRPAKAASGAAYENAKIKLTFHTKGDEAILEREGKPLAEKCTAAKPGA